MKALSIRQPWCWLILFAGKDIENRERRDRQRISGFNHRGRTLIHASKGMTRAEYECGLATAHQVSRTRPFPSGLTLPPFDELPRGGFVGSVDIVDCVERSASPWFVGQFGFVLRDPKPLPFRPYIGTLGFFHVHEDGVA